MSKDMKSPFEAGLNQHGHAFNHRIIDEARKIGKDIEGRGWKVLAIECPVKIHGTSTRIDFILEHRSAAEANLLVAECKRVNPAFSSWCFAKAPYQTPAWTGLQLVVEGISNFKERNSAQSAGTGRSLNREFKERIYDIGLVLQASEKGDPHPVSSGKDAIEDACSQVLRGLNGLILSLLQDEYVYEHISSLNAVRLLPVIFTTAQLWTSSVDLRTTDIEKGIVTLEEEPVKQDWLFYQYPQSPGLKHEIKRAIISQDSFVNVIARDFIRSVAIVNPRGVDQFLREVWLDVVT